MNTITSPPNIKDVISALNTMLIKDKNVVPVYRKGSPKSNRFLFLIACLNVWCKQNKNISTLQYTDIPCVEFTVDPDTVIPKSAFNNSIPSNQAATVFGEILDIFYSEISESGKVPPTHCPHTIILKGHSLCISITITSPKNFKIIAYNQ